ncbi:hypothetical protein [Kocuria atrinae]|uniref:hypothetical protein n=1 Tax=Kocuria atrinae TaxID=592377 RepID=UPI001CB8DA33|nr:hypothetical protein [Kocuria atrinae]
MAAVGTAVLRRLVWFASVWCGTATRRVWAAAVPGLLTYVLSWAYAYLKNGSAWWSPRGRRPLAWSATRGSP